MDSIYKDEFIRLIAKKGGFQLKDSRDFYDSFISVLQDCIKDKQGLNLIGLGRLYFVEVKSAKHRFSGDEELKEYPGGTKVLFSLSPLLRKILKNKE